jgi:hypothetical protein
MVGILIILIVIAGVRVSRAPVTAPPVSPEASPMAAEPASGPPSRELAEMPVLELPELRPPTAVEAVPQPQLSLEPIDPPMASDPAEPPAVEPHPAEPPPLDPELVARVDTLAAEMAALQGQQLDVDRALAATRQQTGSTLQQLASVRRQVQSEQQTLERGRELVEAFARTLEQSQRELAVLQVTLGELDAQRPQPEIVRHRLTAMGREVTGDELHFLLTNGRVATVPLEPLAERVKVQLQRQKDRFLQMQRYSGTVGPVQGFRMEFTAERQAISMIDELRYGTALLRVGVTEYRLLPDSSLKAETADEARRPHSDFHSVLRSARSGITLTFWVHPDSFELHCQLLELAHAAGFEVASRPLPAGVPITGSPNGSRSVAQ